MALIAFALSLFIAGLGVVGTVSPSTLLRLVGWFQTPTGLYVAAAIRIVLGAALFLAAPTSRAPKALRVLGVFIFVAGLATPVFGLDRFRGVIEWWAARGQAFMRVWAGFALVFGLLLAYAVMPGRARLERSRPYVR
jgi:hypothetical protein